MGGRVMITALEELRMKYIALTPTRRAELIGSLSLDEKLLYGAILNAEDEDDFIMDSSGIEELDGELSFGNKTYEDGSEVFVSNKY